MIAKDLITHLLCVDPAQRYTIDEFLAHPWCTASPAPPPPPTPRVQHRSVDSPLLSAPGNWEGRSPGVATLKEAFDITYAVHRMEEEGARRRKFGGAGAGGARAHLSGLNEDDEDEEDDTEDEEVVGDRQRAPAQESVGPKNHPPAMDGRAGARDLGSTRGANTATGRGERRRRQFELDMDGATLLERRQRRAIGGNVGGIPMQKGDRGYASSPLRMDGLSMNDRPPQEVGSPMNLG